MAQKSARNPAPNNQTDAATLPVKRGRGRPKGSKDILPRIVAPRRRSFRELYDSEVEKHAPKLVKALIKAALRGDSRAQVDLANRVLGKPKETVELSGPGGAPLALQAAAPVALALMTTEELRALAALNRRLGVPDIEAAPIHRALAEHGDQAPDPPDVPGDDGSSPPPSLLSVLHSPSPFSVPPLLQDDAPDPHAPEQTQQAAPPPAGENIANEDGGKDGEPAPGSCSHEAQPAPDASPEGIGPESADLGLEPGVTALSGTQADVPQL